MASRRGFIRTIGGTGVILAASAAGLATCDRMPATAVAPWQGPTPATDDPRERALAWAILAPNPHNMQPWLADLREPGVVTLSVDRTRLLPMTDPFGRQITIGHGTFLELLDIAAREAGQRLVIELYPEGGDDPMAISGAPVARITFTADPDVGRDPLFAAIAGRRSTKQPYDMQRPPSAPALAALGKAVAGSTAALSLAAEPEAAAPLAALAGEAIALEMATPRTLRESIEVTRIGAAAIAAAPDGIDLHGPLLWWLQRLGLMTPQKAMTPGTLAHQGGLDYALAWVAGTPAMGWLTTPGNTRRDQIAAGRAYLRLDLAAAAAGLAIHPVSQLLQEYPEMAPLGRRFRTATGTVEPATVQMLFRLGYAERPGPSPRRPVTAIITS
jgi:hypothetical protein